MSVTVSPPFGAPTMAELEARARQPPFQLLTPPGSTLTPPVQPGQSPPLGRASPIWPTSNPVGTERYADPRQWDTATPARYGGGFARPAPQPDPLTAAVQQALAPAANTEYGSVLPVARDVNTGQTRLALPSSLRSLAQGWFDLTQGPRTGTVTPEGTAALASVSLPMGVPEQGVLFSGAGGAGRSMADIGGGQRGMRAVTSLRSMTPAEASVQAATDAHIIPKDVNNPNGGFIGAPDRVKNHQDLQTRRDNLDRAIDGGAGGRDWYQRARDWISSVTGSSGTPARRMAEGLGVFSPQSDPGTNLQFYLQAQNAWMRGEPLPIVRTGQQAATFNTGMAAKEAAAAAGEPEPDIRLGPKTGPFAWHLSPDRPYGTTGVNDIWHSRSFGYRNPDGSEFDGTPSEQQHMFMDYETLKAIDRANDRASGGYTDWDAASVQAAPWVANKEASLRVRYPKWSDEKVRETALKTFPDFALGSTAYMPHEQVPGASTGLYDILPESQRGTYTQAATWRDPTGRDILTGPMFPQAPMSETGGTYINSRGELETNPAQTANPLIDFLARSEPPEIHPGTKQALTGASYVRGLLDMQEGSPWHHIDTRPDQSVGGMDSLRVTGPRPTPDQTLALQKIADRHGFFLSDTGDGISFIGAERPKELTQDGSLPSPTGTELKQRLKGGLSAEINQALPGANVAMGRQQGGYADLSDVLDAGLKGQGKATDRLNSELQGMRQTAPRMYDAMVDNPGIAAKARANLDRLTPEMREARPDYVRLLETIGGGNLRTLLDHVQKYGAIGLPALLATLGSRRQDRQ